MCLFLYIKGQCLFSYLYGCYGTKKVLIPIPIPVFLVLLSLIPVSIPFPVFVGVADSDTSTYTPILCTFTHLMNPYF